MHLIVQPIICLTQCGADTKRDRLGADHLIPGGGGVWFFRKKIICLRNWQKKNVCSIECVKKIICSFMCKKKIDC